MDCIHYKVREDGRILSRAAYIVPDITVDGYDGILSIIVGAYETLALWELEKIKKKGEERDRFKFCVNSKN